MVRETFIRSLQVGTTGFRGQNSEFRVRNTGLEIDTLGLEVHTTGLEVGTMCLQVRAPGLDVGTTRFGGLNIRLRGWNNWFRSSYDWV